MTGPKRHVQADLRERLAIPPGRLDDLNAFLFDPDARVVNDVLAVIARYGTPEEINERARAAGELPALLDRVRASHPAYLADLAWLTAQRDEGAFVQRRRLPARRSRGAGRRHGLPRRHGGDAGGERAPVLPVGHRRGAGRRSPSAPSSRPAGSRSGG